MARENEIIEGRYKIIRRIGTGGMSSVYLALDLNLNKPWALKEISKQGKDNNDDIFVASAMAEANIMKRLDHPFLPRIVDIIDRDGYLYVVMDYIEGETIGSIINRKKIIPESQVIEWAIDLCSVLDYLHSQNPPIIYRDMKPDNIMLMPNGQIKLIDFGIAREYKTENIQDTVCLGTKGYAAPEQFGGQGQSDQRTDVYCLGVTLYHLLTGKNPSKPPYRLYPIRHWDNSLSPGLEKVILKCTEQNPDDRYQDINELKYAILNHEKEDEGYIKKKRRIVNAYRMTIMYAIIFAFLGIATMWFYEYMASGEELMTQFENEMSMMSQSLFAPLTSDVLGKIAVLFDTLSIMNFIIGLLIHFIGDVSGAKAELSGKTRQKILQRLKKEKETEENNGHRLKHFKVRRFSAGTSEKFVIVQSDIACHTNKTIWS